MPASTSDDVFGITVEPKPLSLAMSMMRAYSSFCLSASAAILCLRISIINFCLRCISSALADCSARSSAEGSEKNGGRKDWAPAWAGAEKSAVVTASMAARRGSATEVPDRSTDAACSISSLCCVGGVDCVLSSSAFADCARSAASKKRREECILLDIIERLKKMAGCPLAMPGEP